MEIISLIALKTIAAIQERPWEFVLFSILVIALMIGWTALHWHDHDPE